MTNKKVVDAKAYQIVEAIITDLKGRSGLNDEWYQTDQDIKDDDIRPAWRGIVRAILGGEL